MGYLRLRGRGQLPLSGGDSRPVHLRLSTDDAAGGEVVCGPYELLEMTRSRYGCTSCPRATSAGVTYAAGIAQNLPERIGCLNLLRSWRGQAVTS
jgi:hypothetical protein